MIGQNEFDKYITRFGNPESYRDDLWYRCRKLIQKGYDYEAYSLLLATWNFAHFRYVLTTLNKVEFERTISKTNKIFKLLKGKTFENVNFKTNQVLRKQTQKIFDLLSGIIKQTGAAKLMALKMPELFIMWDTRIRKMYKINNSTSEHYLEFMIKMQNDFKHLKAKSGNSLAKTIDEYNYVKANKKK